MRLLDLLWNTAKDRRHLADMQAADVAEAAEWLRINIQSGAFIGTDAQRNIDAAIRCLLVARRKARSQWAEIVTPDQREAA